MLIQVEIVKTALKTVPNVQILLIVIVAQPLLLLIKTIIVSVPVTHLYKMVFVFLLQLVELVSITMD